MINIANKHATSRAVTMRKCNFFSFLLPEEENIKPLLEIVMTPSSTDFLGIFTPVSDTSLLIHWCKNSWMKIILITDNHICPQHGRLNYCPICMNNFFNNLKCTLWRVCIHSMFSGAADLGACSAFASWPDLIPIVAA